MTQLYHTVVVVPVRPEKVGSVMEGSRVALYMGNLDRGESVRAHTRTHAHIQYIYTAVCTQVLTRSSSIN